MLVYIAAGYGQTQCIIIAEHTNVNIKGNVELIHHNQSTNQLPDINNSSFKKLNIPGENLNFIVPDNNGKIPSGETKDVFIKIHVGDTSVVKANSQQVQEKENPGVFCIIPYVSEEIKEIDIAQTLLPDVKSNCCKLNPSCHESGPKIIQVPYGKSFQEKAGTSELIKACCKSISGNIDNTLLYVSLSDQGQRAANLPANEKASVQVCKYNKNQAGLLNFSFECGKLKWSTASETNCSHFLLMFSYDGTIWNILGQVYGSGFSSVANHYKYPTSLKNVYFKIFQVFYDGNVTEHEPIFGACSKKNQGSSHNLTPENSIFISCSELCRLELFDQFGRLIKIQSLEKHNSINLSAFAIEAF